MLNYLSKFGITYNPFLKEHDIKIETDEFKQLFFRLKRLEQTKGIGVIMGAPGLGKTTSVRYWIKTLSQTQFKVIYIPLSTISVSNFYRILADELNLEPNSRKHTNYKNIQNEIKRLNLEKGITPVIIIDEANYLTFDILNDLKMLLNFDMDSRDRAILLMIGQNQLKNTLNLKSNEALSQRISMIYNFGPLSRDEAKNYIDVKLQTAGLNVNIISDEAYNNIINHANGISRVINQVMDKCLLLLANRKEDVITEQIALDAISEVSIN